MYFPQDIYFGFDQARDAFATLDILKGDFKLIGPPSAASANLFPGPLAYYIYAPIYFLFNKNPEALSAFLRLYNSFGILLVFLIGRNLFNKQVGLISAFLFAISYEQSQYSLFLSHQALATLTVLLFYLGFSFVLFKNNPVGLLLTALGLGLSIQFHYSYILLVPILVLMLLFFRKKFSFDIKYYLFSLLILLITISSYILAEFKFNFKFLNEILLQPQKNISIHLQTVYSTINRSIHDNLSSVYPQLTLLMLIVLLIIFSQKYFFKAIFLLLWFIGGLGVYALSGVPSYYYGASSSVSFLVLAGYISYLVFSRRVFLGIIILSLIIISNTNLITTFNPQGVNKDFIIQPEMLISREKEVLDFIYQKASGDKFAVSAITVPFNIKTTWDYLFNWYGMQKYHYLPVWGHEAAEGFYGNLKVETDRSRLPEKRFLIIEPVVGIRPQLVDQFIKEENYFSKVIETKKFGTITVEYRERI